MTTDEKAKAYEMALEGARKELGVDRKEWEVVQQVLHNIFPELRESEDERIRKAIVGLIEELQRSDKNFAGVELADMLSYLEKQKEQKPRWEINNPHTTKWTKEMIDEKFEELVKEYHKQKPVVTHGETYHVDTLGTQQVIAGKMPQKPAEWSKEDKAIISCIVCCLDGQFVTEAARKQCLEWFNQHRRDFLNQSKQEWSEEDENKIESIKGLITMGKFVDTNTIKTIWKLLDSLRPQPKVEWSEEDEEMLNSCICSIEESKENRYAYKETDGDTSYDHEIAWLKSLRPQWKPSEQEKGALQTAIHILTDGGSIAFTKAAEQLQNILDAFEGKESRKDWKPSEEQMDRLFSIVAALRKDYCDDMADFLASLYKQLKKLM